MDPTTSARLERLFSGDNAERNLAFHQIIAATDEPVDWAYQIWDRAVAGLTDRDNQVRAVSAQLLCNLAKSDPDQRILLAFDALLNVTRDARFVTARHCLQNNLEGRARWTGATGRLDGRTSTSIHRERHREERFADQIRHHRRPCPPCGGIVRRLDLPGGRQLDRGGTRSQLPQEIPRRIAEVHPGQPIANRGA